MIKHGSSHAFAVLGSTVLSALIIELIKPLFPGFLEWVEKKVNLYIIKYIKADVSPRIVTILLLAVLLGFLWGAFFKRKFDND